MATPSSKATQEFVPIKEVRDGVVILKDGGMRGVLMTSSLNFALKSSDEQEAIIMQFQNMLNSINFSIQIFMESRRLDIRPYISLLEQRQKEQVGDLLKVQTKEYIEFIKSFTESTNIMTKTFFIVVPYTAAILSSNSSKGLAGGLLQKKQTKNEKTQSETDMFEEDKSQLEQRLGVV
jgi:type IV secretory pathway VirB4 component